MICLTFCQHSSGNSIKKASETISVSVTQPSYLAYLAGEKCSQKIVTFVYESTVLPNRSLCNVETKFPL